MLQCFRSELHSNLETMVLDFSAYVVQTEPIEPRCQHWTNRLILSTQGGAHERGQPNGLPSLAQLKTGLGMSPGVKDKRTCLVQRIPSEEWTSGSSFNRFSLRLSFWRFISPQGIMEGREAKQFAERSSSVIWWEISISQSRSTQGSLRFDQFTERT